MPPLVDPPLAREITALVEALELASPGAVLTFETNTLAVLDVARRTRPEDVIDAIQEARPGVRPELLAAIKAAMIYQGDRLVLYLPFRPGSS